MLLQNSHNWSSLRLPLPKRLAMVNLAIFQLERLHLTSWNLAPEMMKE